MRTQHFDLVVVGAGSGGYAAARTARDLGARVALVDHGPLGGLCILRGCMPSKTLLASGDAVQAIRESPKLGVRASPPAIDFSYIIARKREIIRGFADYRIEGIRSFPLFEGPAHFLSPGQLQVGDGDVLEAANFIIATGSIVAPPTLAGLAEAGYIDSDAALELERPPKSLIVLGGGYVATELGQFFARMGAATTMLMRASHVFSGEDDDVGDAVTFYFREEGIRMETGAQLSRVERRAGGKVVHYLVDGVPKSVEAEEIFYALGRVPNVAGLDLEKAGVAYHAITGIEIGPDLRTTNPAIFAIGDVTGPYELVHVAIYQGEMAARNAVGARERADYWLIKTRCVFTDPQIGIVGETEKELQRSNTAYLRGSYLFSDHGKAVSIGRTKGFVKMMASPDDGRILGAAIVGPEASDLIHELIVAMSFGATVDQFVKIPHLHPTLAEIWTYPADDIIAQRSLGSSAVAVVV